MNLQEIKNSPTPVYMTPQSGYELASKGFISIHEPDPSGVPNSFRVLLTPLGEAEAQKQNGQPMSKPVFEVESGVPVPAVRRGNPSLTRNRESSYPFDKLEVSQSFHVAVTAKVPEPWTKMASSVNAANKKTEVPWIDPATGQQTMENKTVKKIVKNADGSNALDSNGKKTYTSSTVAGPKMKALKKFRACKVGDQDPKGPGCRVFRVE